MQKKHSIRLIGMLALAIVGLMAVTASAAQAKYWLYLNGSSVSSLNLLLAGLASYIKAENGLKISCTNSTGTAELDLQGENFVNAFIDSTSSGCVWVGAEKTCTIYNEGAGYIRSILGHIGQLKLLDPSTYAITVTSFDVATVYTEGPFCTIPEEEVISGTFRITIPATSAVQNTTMKTGTLSAVELFLGKSRVTEWVDEVHIWDENPSATFAFI